MFQEKLSGYLLDTVGGFVKPHGKQHDNVIRDFNLRLCKSLITKLLPEDWSKLKDKIGKKPIISAI